MNTAMGGRGAHMGQAGGQLITAPTHQKLPTSETPGSLTGWHTIQTLKAILMKKLSRGTSDYYSMNRGKLDMKIFSLAKPVCTGQQQFGNYL